MKYAILGPQGGINRIADTQPQNTPEGTTVVEITDEQAATVEAGRTGTPKVFYFWIDGELKTMAEKQAIAQAARFATLDQPQRIKAAQAYIGTYFTAFDLMEGLQKLMKAQAAGNLAAIPKTVAVATWVETVKGMALAGIGSFPPPPHTFDEITVE